MKVLVKIHGAGLCHSDLSVINGSRLVQLPAVLGREGSGEIVELGSAIKDVNIGDHVVFNSLHHVVDVEDAWKEGLKYVN